MCRLHWSLSWWLFASYIKINPSTFEPKPPVIVFKCGYFKDLWDRMFACERLPVLTRSRWCGIEVNSKTFESEFALMLTYISQSILVPLKLGTCAGGWIINVSWTNITSVDRMNSCTIYFIAHSKQSIHQFPWWQMFQCWEEWNAARYSCFLQDDLCPVIISNNFTSRQQTRAPARCLWKQPQHLHGHEHETNAWTPQWDSTWRDVTHYQLLSLLTGGVQDY